jgi:hypothetical protein
MVGTENMRAEEKDYNVRNPRVAETIRVRLAFLPSHDCKDGVV